MGQPQPAVDIRAGVVGAGTMGLSIAQWLAFEGVPVTLTSRRAEPLREFQDSVEKFFDRKVHRGRMSEEDRQRRLRDCATSRSYDDLSRACIVFECVAEDLDIKRRVFREIETIGSDTMILASNTSSLRITEIAAATRCPQRAIGVHFFQPVRFTRVVEVIRGAETDDATLARTLDILRRVQKLPIVVKESPGFLVNRLAGVYLTGAMRLAEEGVAAPRDVDAALKEWGMGIGPFELADMIGLDVLQVVARILCVSCPDRYCSSSLLDQLVSAGRLGRKAGRGIYDYDDRHGDERGGMPGRDLEAGRAPGVGALVDRIVEPLVAEALDCLREGVASAEEIDLAAVECLRMPKGPLELLGEGAVNASRELPAVRREDA